VREALVVFIVVGAIFVALLDGFGVFSAWQNVRGDAKDASQAAFQSLLEHNNDPTVARQAADSSLRQNGDAMTSFSISQPQGSTPQVTVSATREAKTYVFKYGTHLPLVGGLFKHMLRAHATRSSGTDY